MDRRLRSYTTNTAIGIVYFVYSNGFVEQVGGPVTYAAEAKNSDDYWHKKKRSDGSLPVSPCVIWTVFRDPLRINRATNLGGPYYAFSQYPIYVGAVSLANLVQVRPAIGSIARNNENIELGLQLLAATNPLRDEFSVPVFAKELVEISSLFKLAAGSLAGYLGSSYLNYKFGWVQFVRDLKTLSTITVAIERRIKEFQSLSMKGGLRRKINLKATSDNFVGGIGVIQSTYGVTMHGQYIGSRNCQTHGTVRWRYKPGFDTGLYKLEGFNQAVSKVFDLGALDSKTVWNMVPFSWLVDYFVDLNTWLGANDGSIFLEPYDICIVRKSKYRAKLKVTSKPLTIDVSGTGVLALDSYERDIVALSSLTLPRISLLSGWELLTATALFASFKR